MSQAWMALFGGFQKVEILFRRVSVLWYFVVSKEPPLCLDIHFSCCGIVAFLPVVHTQTEVRQRTKRGIFCCGPFVGAKPEPLMPKLQTLKLE